MAITFGAIFTVLVLLHLVMQWWMDHVPAHQIIRTGEVAYRAQFRLMHLDREMSMPAWLASLLIAGNALLMLALGWVRRRQGRGDVAAWVVLGVVFLLMSLDESAAMHEQLVTRMHLWLGDHATHLLYFSWFVPVLAALIPVGLWLLPAWMRLPPTTRWGMAASLTIYLAGAVAVEALSGVEIERLLDPANPEVVMYRPTALLTFYTVAEELLELIGMGMLMCVLIYEMRPNLKIQIVDHADSSPPT